MKNSETHFLKYVLGAIIIAGVLLYFTGSWPIALSFLSAVILSKPVEIILDTLEGGAFGKMIENILYPNKGSVNSLPFPRFLKNFIGNIFRLIKRFFNKEQLSTKEYFQLYFVAAFSVFLLLLIFSTPAIALNVLWIFITFILCILFIAGLHYLIGFIFPNTI